ncbi:MAG: hypothetical protein WC322_03270 [Candidatus Paceibacterota bacterium]
MIAPAGNIDDFIYWENSDEWEVVPAGDTAVIANKEIVRREDINHAAQEYEYECGDCGLARTNTCQRCFFWPVLLIHDTFLAGGAHD